MNDSNSCDCFIGFISGERVFKSTIHIEASSISQIQPVFKQYGLMKGEPLTPKQILDNRRGYLSRFACCPYCGNSINWKQIINKK